MGHTLNKILASSIVLFITMMLLAGIQINAQTAVAPAAGDGSSGNPYQITTWDNLYWITQDTDRWDDHYIQTANIDFADASPAITTWDTGSGFTPIGNLTVQFTGTYDGAGFTITGLFINRGSTNLVGMFGGTNTGAEIKNIGLIGINITGKDYIGGLVGWSVNSILNDSYSTGSVSGNFIGGLVGINNGSITNSYSTSSVNSSGTSAGGLVGRNDAGTVSNSYSTGSVSGYNFIGGLVGLNYGGTSTITNSFSTGSVSGNTAVGGLVGQQHDGSISFSYSTGLVSGSSSVGGFLGINFSGTINNSFWNTQTSGQSSSGGGTGKTTTQMKTLSTFINDGWDFAGETVNGSNDYWVKDTLEIKNNGYPYLEWQAEPSGNGTSGNPYKIETLIELNWVTQNPASWDKDFLQTANIDASSTSTWDGGAGFTPIGNAATAFTGSYDGNGFYILSLFINRSSTSNIGMFGKTGAGTEIKNFGLDVNITGDSYVGSLVGYNSGGTITNSFSTGSVTGTTTVGGLVGFNAGNINNSYATVSGSGNTSVGGLVGSNEGGITNSYSNGPVSGITTVGGLVGSNIGTLSSSFWDTQTSDQSTSSGGTGKTTAEMKELSTYINAGWDFEIETANGTNNYWDIDNVYGTYFSGYPFLSWYNTTETSVKDVSPSNSIGNPSDSLTSTGTVTYGITYSDAGTINLTGGDVTLNTTGTATGTVAVINGTTSNPTVTISNMSGIGTIGISIDAGTAISILGSLFSASAGPSTTFTFDISLPVGSGTSADPYLIAILDNLQWIIENAASWDKDFLQTANIDASSTSTWDDGAGFTPIGNAATAFTGSYDGNGFYILSLFINRSSSNIGMFGKTGAGAEIKNVGIQNINITGESFTVGSVVGNNLGSTITNCYSSGSVNGHVVGGLVGSNEGSITNSYSTCSVTSSTNNVGGLVGSNINSAITSSYSSGSVSGNTNIGGLAGLNYGGTSTITNSYSSGSITGTTTIGGLVGSNEGGITNSYSSGSVTGTTTVGGLVGSNSGILSNSFWDTETSNQFTIGVSSGSSSGVTGKTTVQMKTAQTFSDAGWDNSIWNIGDGINDGYSYLAWQNTGGTALPVELTSFTAGISELKVVLNWQTATEVNNYGFEVERASSLYVGTSPVKDWETLGFVPGHGNSNSPKSYSFIDNDYNKDGRIVYRLKQIDTDGSFEYFSTTAEVNIGITGIAGGTIPEDFSLSQNYPNPFNPTTTIRYGLPEESNVKVMIYNLLGQLVTTLTDEVKKAGYYDDVFNAGRLASGTYLVSIYSESTMSKRKYSTVKKMMLIK